MHSGTLSSFCFSFFRFAPRGEAKKRKTDKTISTMLPQAKRRLSGAPRKSCQLRMLPPSRKVENARKSWLHNLPGR
jgi:hypothetical protein